MSGAIAVTALSLNIVLLTGALAYFGAALTLPGIAGIILTVGMAIDANVLVFERIREEIKIGKIMIRATPVMEILLGFIIASFIYFSGFLIANGEIGINNFFSFLAAMMLAYQPVRSLATLSLGINQGISAGRRILPIIDYENRFK